MPKISDLDKLVERAKRGDAEAFAQIYDELVKPVYRYIYYRVEDVIAEDLTEETFLKVWQNLKKYKKGKNPFSSWVFRIAHNLVVDHYRQNKTTEMIEETMADTKRENNPHQQADLKLTQIRLRKVIRHLPDNYQEVIILKYINELDNKEIADTIGKSEGAVRTIQFRALERLRSLLSDERKDF
ncbi:sigma-70 family RNA polymerase sigma factor [Candidatus Peregrinibacteria bacterium]|nr:sigma-70 family RNA polymerase sigma factor [Candidatus Peregrinibacteria bacterium]